MLVKQQPNKTKGDTNMTQTSFKTIIEHTEVVNNKEFRVMVTQRQPQNTFTVGVREYARTPQYTGYSKGNGVTIPAPDEQTAIILASTIANSLKQTGNMFGLEV